jgi:hypothetical protein
MTASSLLGTSLSRSTLERAAFAFLGMLSLVLLFNIVPYYNWWYRIILGLAGIVLLLLSSLAVFILLALNFHRQQTRRVILIATWVLTLFLTWKYVLPLRQPLTELLIQRVYCQQPLAQGEIVLGGIKHFEGLFINDSYCLIVVCAEEFYSCV